MLSGNWQIGSISEELLSGSRAGEAVQGIRSKRGSLRFMTLNLKSHGRRVRRDGQQTAARLAVAENDGVRVQL